MIVLGTISFSHADLNFLVTSLLLQPTTINKFVGFVLSSLMLTLGEHFWRRRRKNLGTVVGIALKRKKETRKHNHNAVSNKKVLADSVD